MKVLQSTRVRLARALREHVDYRVYDWSPHWAHDNVGAHQHFGYAPIRAVRNVA